MVGQLGHLGHVCRILCVPIVSTVDAAASHTASDFLSAVQGAAADAGVADVFAAASVEDVGTPAAATAGLDCYYLDWAGDGYCDEQNNVEACVEINWSSLSGAPDNSALSHFSAMTWPTWLGRAARNRHRHAIEQASRRWRGGRRDDSARMHHKF